MNKKEAKEYVKKHGWNKKLGYSKKELGIETTRPDKRRKCGCVYQYESGGWMIKTRCQKHQEGFEFKKKYYDPKKKK